MNPNGSLYDPGLLQVAEPQFAQLLEEANNPQSTGLLYEWWGYAFRTHTEQMVSKLHPLSLEHPDVPAVATKI